MLKSTHMLRVRFDDAQWQRLKALSEAADRTMSDLVRDHLHRVNVRNRLDEKERNRMLKLLNSNLNMIARWVNTYKSNADSFEVIAQLKIIEKSIEELSK